MMKKAFFTGMKLIICAALVGWLLKNGKLDFKLSYRLIEKPEITLICLLLCSINIILPGIRLGLILKARSKKQFGIVRMSLVNWMGMFFSSVLPGSVSGDLLKIFYIKKWDSQFSNSFLLFAGFVDRFMGLVGLTLILGFFSILNYNDLVHLSPKLEILLHFNFLLCAGVFLLLFLFYIIPHRVEKLLSGRILNLWKDLRAIKVSLAKALGVSIIIQFISVVTFYVLTFSYYQTDLDFVHLLSFIPIGFVAMAIPIAPGGLGVGHAVFQELFSFVGENEGANFFNLFFLLSIGINIFGLIPYLFYKRNQNSETHTV